jgi:hypothetical protein
MGRANSVKSAESQAGAGPVAATTSTGEGSQQAAFIAFVVILVIALPALLYLGRERWFQYDDWDFISARSAGSLHDLFAPHVVHWSTLPILVYRALWTVFGVHSYVPYQTVAILSHIGVVALVRVVMRRAGVAPWTATIAATLLLFLGSGYENITWAFGVTFSSALAFGLIQLLLADHDGPLDRRDWLALLAGLAGLMCSGIAVTMVIVVGIAVFVRRGWKMAAFQTAPLAAVFLVWFAAIGREGYDTASSRSDLWGFVSSTTGTAFDRIAQQPFFGWALAALIVGGCFLAWRGRTGAELRTTAVLPAAMFVGGFLFFVITGLGRGEQDSSWTRYTHIFVTLALPAIAVAADAIMRRWRYTAPVFAIVFLLAIVPNIRLFDNAEQRQTGDFQRGYRKLLFSMPRLPVADKLPRDLHPELSLAPYVSMGFLIDGVESGRIPDPGAIDPTTKASTELKIALGPQLKHRASDCASMTAPADVQLEAGSSLRLSGPVTIVYTNSKGDKSPPTPYAANPRNLVAYAGPLRLRVQTTPANGTFELCDPDGGTFKVPEVK